MLVAQCPVGVDGDLGTEQVAGFALELEHVEQVTVAGDVAAKPAGGIEGEIGDAVPGSDAAQLGGMGADLLLGGGRQMRWLCEWMAHATSSTARGGIRRARRPRGQATRDPGTEPRPIAGLGSARRLLPPWPVTAAPS